MHLCVRTILLFAAASAVAVSLAADAADPTGDAAAENDRADGADAPQAPRPPAHEREVEVPRAPEGDGEPAESNLDYWLKRAKPADEDAASEDGPEAAADGQGGGTGGEAEGDGGTAEPAGPIRRRDALPGVLKLSDGRLLPGEVFTTRNRPFLLYVEAERRWRRVPPAAVLSVTAVVVEEKMELEWRWKAMGEPERVYTGRSYPTRRLLWKLHLADGSSMTGAIKGQPIWVQAGGRRHGPFVLHERTKGKIGQTLDDIVYVEKVVISRRLREKVEAYLQVAAGTDAEAPAGQQDDGETTNHK